MPLSGIAWLASFTWILTQPFGGGGGACIVTHLNVLLVTLPFAHPSAATTLGTGICLSSQSARSSSLCASTRDGTASHDPSELANVTDFALEAGSTTSAESEVSAVVSDPE